VKLKRRWQQPSLDGVIIKIDQAERHFGRLERETERVFPGHFYTIAPEIHGQGTRHIFNADSPPTIPPEWSAIVGDCIHNLRTSLDHLAYELVRVCNGTPNQHTAFPIMDAPPEDGSLPSISGRVTTEVSEVLKVVQPYSGGQPGRGLRLIRDLDNIDKHRRLVVIVATTDATLSTAIGGDPNAPPPSTTIFTGRPLEHGKQIAVVTYERPFLHPDPNLKFMVDVSLGEGRLCSSPVRAMFGALSYLVRDDILPRFERFFTS
jgi:hypothetical protein